MTARATFSRLLRAMGRALGPSPAAPFPFFAAWPGAPVCWARHLEPGPERATRETTPS
jgi:hypothetical protein